MIEEGVTFMEANRDYPSVVSKEWAVAPCGCTVYVGIRLDTEEYCVPIRPCRKSHEALCAEVMKRVAGEIADPLRGDRNVVETADRVLSDVFGALAS